MIGYGGDSSVDMQISSQPESSEGNLGGFSDGWCRESCNSMPFRKGFLGGFGIAGAGNWNCAIVCHSLFASYSRKYQI